ncbi:MAG: hypothetical protein JNL18_19150 [Planctomycetaceae bacterium]|nr:hypothetical protein [Planctomycetaceae bacterium]
MRIAKWAAVAAIGFSVGCGGSDAPAPSASNGAAGGNGAAAPGPSGEIPSDPVGRVVYDFLESVRVGQGENAAAKLLTPLALQKIQEQDLNIAPPGSPTARFKVTHVEMLEGDRAVVESTWSDVDADGKQYQEPIYCALRICDGQWRIHGMAQYMGEGQQPMVIDFENLDALIEQQPAPQNVPSDQLVAPAAEQPAASVATDPFNQPAQR